MPGSQHASYQMVEVRHALGLNSLTARKKPTELPQTRKPATLAVTTLLGCGGDGAVLRGAMLRCVCDVCDTSFNVSIACFEILNTANVK